MPASGQEPERLQKVLSRLGLASRREAEAWIRAGRLSVNGRPATLGMRVGADDHLRLDGRPIRQPVRSARAATAYLCHRSPGEQLMVGEHKSGAHAVEAVDSASPAAAEHAALEHGAGERATLERAAVERAAPAFGGSVAGRLPRSAGRRFIAVSPMPRPDGGLELLTADGDLAARLQRAVHRAEVEFTVRVRGELTPEQDAGVRGGELDAGRVEILVLEPAGGEGSNRWYRLLTRGASGSEVRQLLARQAVAVVRVLRTRLGTLTLPRELARGRSHALAPEAIAGFLRSGAPAVAQVPPKLVTRVAPRVTATPRTQPKRRRRSGP